MASEQPRDKLGRWVRRRRTAPAPKASVGPVAAAPFRPSGARQLLGPSAGADLAALSAAVRRGITAKHPEAAKAARLGRKIRSAEPGIAPREVADRLVLAGFSEPDAVLAAGPLRVG